MVKKFRDYSGMQDMFTQQAINEKTALFEAARAKLEEQIHALEAYEDQHDSGLSAIENRNEINYLKDEIRYLEKQYCEDIAKLKANQK